MKKFLSVLLSIIMVLSVCPLTALAEEVVAAYESNTAEGETGSAIEPDQTDLGINVSASGSNDYCTWSYDSETKTMTINGKLIKGMPDGEYPNALPTYTVDESGNKVFAYFGFENLIFGSDVREFELAYINESYYPNLKFVSLENTKVTVIGEKLFECCNASEIKLPENLEDIGDDAFRSSYIDNIVIPSKVTHIGASAFAESAVATVSFGNIHATVDDYVFKNCTYLTSVDMQNAVLTSGNDTPMVPKGIFMGCTMLTDVKLNDNIKTVGSSAFSGCSSLESVSIPNADVIQLNAFTDCTKLSNLNRNPDKAITIGQFAFSGTSSLQNEDFNNIVGLGQYAFQHSAVQNCTIYSYGSEENAGENAFYCAKNLKNVTIKNNYISNYMFGAAVVDTVNFVSAAKDMIYFYTYCFANATIKNINMSFPEKSTIKIGSYAFSGAKYIGSKPLKFESEGSVIINKCSFKKFNGEVDFSDCYISKISLEAFRESTISKFEAQVGDKVDNYAFSDCGNLTSFVNTEYRAGTTYGDYVFNKCPKLTKFYSDTPEGDVESSIGKYTFYNCPALSDVKISKVTEIGMHAFENCKSLVSLSFPNLQVFESSAFMNCASLQTIDIGYANEVPSCAFKCCYSLVTVKHSGDVESVEAEAFYCCQDLVNFNTDTVFYIENNAFNGCENFVPNSLKRVKTIGNNAFESCYAITTLQFGHFLTSIGDRAFWECTNLTDVTFSPTSIKFGEYIFDYCLNLKNMTFKGYTYEMPSMLGYVNFSDLTIYCGKGTSAETFANSHKIKVVNIRPEFSIGGDNQGKLDNGRWVVDNGVLKIYGSGSGELGSVFMLADDTEYATENLIKHYNVTSVEFHGDITSIPDNFFSGCSFDELTRLELPESIKSIGANAFNGVKSTNGFEVVMPANIASIGDYAFANSSVLSFDFSLCKNTYTLGEGVFSGNQKLTSIDINTPAIPKNAFYGDKALTSVTLHNQTSIGDSAFENTGLTEINFPNALNLIGDYAFKNSAIIEVSIPASVKKIGAGVFTNCLKLMSVTVNSLDTEFNFASIISPENSMGYRSDGSRIYGFKIKADPRSKAHAYSVKALLDFEPIKLAYNSTGYVSKNKSINDCARWYYYPDDNTLLITGNSVVGGTFYDENYNPVNFDNVDTVRFFDDVSIIEPGWKAINPKNVYISEMTKQISDKAFADCTNLQAINIPDSVTHLGEYAFDKCSGLKSVTIGKGVQNISAFAFRECIKLQELNILGAVIIGRAAFKDCSKLVTLNLPDTLQTVRTTAFINCYSVIRINFGKNLRIIESYAFANLPFCDEINIDSNITNVSQNAFCNTGISTKGITVNYLDGATSVSLNGYNDANITTLKFSKKFKNLFDYNKLSSLKEIVVEENNENGIYSYQHGLYDNTTLILAPQNIKTLQIKDGTTRIAPYAARYNSFSIVVIPDGVTEIGDNAFSDSLTLKAVKFPKTVETIGNRAFENCTKIKTINIPDPVKTLGERAFYNCKTLAAAVLPEGLQEIKSECFDNCKNIVSMVVPQSVKTIGGGAFSNMSSLEKLYVWKSTVGYAIVGNSPKVTVCTLIGSPTYEYARNYKVPLKGYTDEEVFADECFAAVESLESYLGYCTEGHGDIEWLTVYEPDCENDGYRIGVCEYCSVILQEEHIKAPGHKYHQVAYIKETETQRGIRVFKCLNCGETKTTYTIPTSSKEPEVGVYYVRGSVEALINRNAGIYENFGVENANVIIDGNVVARTDEYGRFSFEMKSGTYAVEIEYSFGFKRIVGLTITDHDVVLTEPIRIVACDFNKDGRVDSADQNLFRIIVSSKKGDPAYLSYVDLNHDGYINAKDYLIIQYFEGTDALTYPYDELNLA